MGIAINLTAIVVAFLALITSTTALCLVIGQRISTHKIEWRPLETTELKEEDKFKEEEEEEDKVLSAALDLQRKKKKKLEDPLDTILETNNF